MSDTPETASTDASKSKTDNTASVPDFENQLAALEDIVAEMEKGEMTLEESLRAYERGIKLTRDCQAALDSAQQRINVLTEKNGLLSEEPFHGES